MVYKTYLPKTEEIKRKWHLIDGSGRVLGRLATEAANYLMGKNKRYFCDHLDCGDFVIVTNSNKIVLTGKKLVQKIDFRHSHFPKGDKYTPYSVMMSEKSDKALLLAVKGMLSKNKLGRAQLKRLRVYKGTEHPHIAQLTIGTEVKS
jgi:large subunit ribosomal protein L13